MAVSATARATQVQCGSIECENGAGFRFQSHKIVNRIQTPGGLNGEASCTNVEFRGTIEISQQEIIDEKITSDTLAGCSVKGVTSDTKTNASPSSPWQLQLQQPNVNGQVTGHIIGTLKFTEQIQVFGFSVATCVYQGSAVQLMGTEQSDTMSIEGSEQFTLVESNSSECGTVNETRNDLVGEVQFETVETVPQSVVVHMV